MFIVYSHLFHMTQALHLYTTFSLKLFRLPSADPAVRGRHSGSYPLSPVIQQPLY